MMATVGLCVLSCDACPKAVMPGMAMPPTGDAHELLARDSPPLHDWSELYKPNITKTNILKEMLVWIGSDGRYSNFGRYYFLLQFFFLTTDYLIIKNRANLAGVVQLTDRFGAIRLFRSSG